MVKPVTPRSQVQKKSRHIKHNPAASFNEYQPLPNPEPPKETAVIIGDLHASVPSLVQRLIEENIIRLPATVYDKLIIINNSTYIEQMDQAYKAWKDYELRLKGIIFSLSQKRFYVLLAKQKKLLYEEIKIIVQNERAELRQVCEQMEVSDTDKLVKLLGDELCDRNTCDYDMLYLIFMLIQKGVKLQSTLSNHALEFLIAALKRDWALDSPMFMLQGCFRSFTALKLLLAHNIITQEELQPLIKAWQESLRVAFCSIHDAGATSYSHAPVGKETYEAFAQLFNIPFKDETPELLDETLMKINAGFKLSLIVGPKSPHYFIKVMEKEFIAHSNFKGEGFPRDTPYLRSTWNRNLNDIIRPTLQEKGYIWDHVCGHEMFEALNSPQTTSLDNMWGKPMDVEVTYSFTKILPKTSEANIVVNSLYYDLLGDNWVEYSGTSCIGHLGISQDYTSLPMKIFKGVVMVSPDASQEIIQQLIYTDMRSKSLSVPLQMNATNCSYRPEIRYMTTNEVFPGSPGLLQNISSKKRILSVASANDAHINANPLNKSHKKSTLFSNNNPSTLFFGLEKENLLNKKLIETASNSSVSNAIMSGI